MKDHSEIYIKMCDCDEIQRTHPWGICDFFDHPKDGNIITMGEINSQLLISKNFKRV